MDCSGRFFCVDSPMNSHVIIDLFVEDQAHEAFVGALVRRIARDEEVETITRIRSARGGHGRALQELRTYQKLIEMNVFDSPPDLIVAAIDGNCATFRKKRTEIENATRTVFQDRLVAACPDPHVERWFLADPDSFHEIVGHRPSVGRRKCERNHYKRLLADAIRQGNHPPTLGGIEFATELADAMDLYRAGTEDSSLRTFVEDLRAKLRGLGVTRSARNETPRP